MPRAIVHGCTPLTTTANQEYHSPLRALALCDAVL